MSTLSTRTAMLSVDTSKLMNSTHAEKAGCLVSIAVLLGAISFGIWHKPVPDRHRVERQELAGEIERAKDVFEQASSELTPGNEDRERIAARHAAMTFLVNTARSPEERAALLRALQNGDPNFRPSPKAKPIEPESERDDEPDYDM